MRRHAGSRNPDPALSDRERRAVRLVLHELEHEPVPERLLTLAQELETALAARGGPQREK